MRTGRRTAHPRASTWMVRSVRNGRRNAAPPTLRRAAIATVIAMAMVAIGPPSRCTMFTAVVARLSFSFGTDAYAADIVGMPIAPARGAQHEADLDAGRREPSLRHPDERERAEDRQEDPGRDDRAAPEAVGDHAHHRIDEDHRDAGGSKQPAHALRESPAPVTR